MAIAPERTGIGIRRHFTTEGTDPYDQVTWERRDARITNFRDGTVAFEQLGVEVPSTWSVNATNILAQKYFRGSLGTPEREWSLRQVADRVVDTITAWGIKDGYFVDDAEAETFRAELKYLIVTQRAAFNSPVWFNIGVKGVPQQASACFILAVEDTMDAILDWYKEEGIIFKGGSGSGINLSKIRSSRETLNGGGTASGPVSFMRGADASAGTIKSGGKTRRAAKMVILNADHPDIEDFIWCKTIEERKARALSDAGFDMDLDGKDSHSIQYQNANNSVRVTDEFMQAVLDDADWTLRAVTDGSPVKTLKARDLFRQISKAAWECADPGMQFDTTINRWHTAHTTGRINGSNPCSEYVHLDNSACNLASLNLLTFLDDDGTFDVEAFRAATELVFTAQEIMVGNADYPTPKIAETTRRFRQLGIGYANLGALLMAQGFAYDSDDGRAWAAAITALLTGHAYATSARTAARMGPFAGYADNKEHMLRVLRMHRDAVAKIDEEKVQTSLLDAAQEAWEDAVELGELYGVRNSQASVLAPTGCLIGGSLVATDRGLVRLRSLGDVEGEQWQALDATVMTDEGQRAATEFYVNGLEPVVKVQTKRGYGICGTTRHQTKVIDAVTREWVWRRFADLRPGDVVPLSLNQLFGESKLVELPPLSESTAWMNERFVKVPAAMSAELAELVGYYMGDGSMHDKGLRFCVTDGDFDVIERLEHLGKALFGIEARAHKSGGDIDVYFNSVRLASWWRASGLAKHIPVDGHRGKGYLPHIPDALLHTNDAEVYRAFLRGLFEADGTVTSGYPSWTTATLDFATEVQTLMLALGFVTTRKVDVSGRGSTLAVVRVLNKALNRRWADEIGFISARKARSIDLTDIQQASRFDYIPMTRELIDRVLPVNSRDRRVALMELKRSGSITRRLAREIHAATGDAELGHLLGFFYDVIASAALADEQLTYDISVPENVTYLANGFVSHNTIGLLMDCDTTGIEPDLGLVKMKKLVGGGHMSIVNQTIPRALRRMGYSAGQVEDIISYIDENKSILGAPHLAAEHVSVFACSMGDNTIHHMGHIRMMSAVQPFLSGAISKCVVGETLVSTADGLVRIGSLHQGEAPDTFRPEVMEVASLGGTQKTEAFYYGGERETFRVVLQSGHEITATPNHRVLATGFNGVDWKRVDELAIGEWVATKYGAELWSALPARFDDFAASPAHARQKAVRIPAEMTSELALLLGAYASEGHTSRSTWTVVITNSVESVLEQIGSLFETIFGVTSRIERREGKCPQLLVHSKTVVEFMEYLGCGARSSTKRIPDAVLRSPREMVLAFLQGLALDAYTSVSSMPKWAICLDSPKLLDDLQAVLTNLGVVHSRITKFNKTYAKSYDEVYATGINAQRVAGLVPFLEPDKASAAAALLGKSFDPNRNSADVVPGIAPAELYGLLPQGKSGRNGSSVRAEFSYLCDPRTTNVARRSLERVAAVPGVVLPPWLQMVLDDNLHFSPVESVVYAGRREVFDVSVPTNNAFVANGIVNHNTVNCPEEITVEEVEQLHIDAWKLGLKAVAIYRDNCKLAQPLSTVKKDVTEQSSEGERHDAELAAKVAELEERLSNQTTVIVKQPVRERMPKRRKTMGFKFRIADCEGFVHVGEYDDGRPGELFIKVAKQGSTLAGIMDAFGIAISVGLQHGVPLSIWVQKFTGTRFEPSGMTDDADLRIASSILDYIFRRLAVDYLPYETRAELGILTSGERIQQTLPGVEEAVTASRNVVEVDVVDVRPTAAALAAAGSSTPATSDAPFCMQCGVQMQRAGSCHICPSCGTTSGCS